MLRAGIIVGLALVIREQAAEACSPFEPPPPRLVYPRHGEVDVATNTRIWISTASNEEHRFRVINPAKIEREIVAIEQLGSTFVLVLRDPLPAESTFIVEVVPRYREDNEVGRFTTGSRRDDTPPKFFGITGLVAERQTVVEWVAQEIFECSPPEAAVPVGTVFSTASVTFGDASDNRSPHEAIFFEVELTTAGGARREVIPLGPRSPGDYREHARHCGGPLPAPQLDKGGMVCARVSAIDASGNRAGNDREICAPVEEIEVAKETQESGCERLEGCACVTPSRATAKPAVVLVLLATALGLRRRSIFGRS